MGLQNSKMETPTSATASTDMGESSSCTKRQVSAYIESFLNETMGSIKEMETVESIKEIHKEDDQPCYESDGCVGIAHHEIKSLLWPIILKDGNGSINEENWQKLKSKISKRKVIKAWLKVLFQGNRDDLITKFFRALRKLRKEYKTMAKKLKDYAKDGMENRDRKQATRLIFLIAVIAVLTSAVIAFLVSPSTAPLGLALAAVVLTFFTILQDWYEIQFNEYETKNKWKEDCVPTGLIKLDEKNGNFALWAEKEFQNIKALQELRQVANSFKRMLKDGWKVIKEKMKEVENKAN